MICGYARVSTKDQAKDGTRDFSNIEKIIQVAATLAIEDMHMDKDIINNLLSVAKKEESRTNQFCFLCRNIYA